MPVQHVAPGEAPAGAVRVRDQPKDGRAPVGREGEEITVGGIIIAMYLPLFDLISKLS